MPREQIIVADSSPLIGLARIGQLHLLPQLAARVVIPAFVWDEVTNAKENSPGAREILAQTSFEILPVAYDETKNLLPLVDRGEAEAIALARLLPNSLLLIDERRGRRVAESLGVRRIGTLGLLVMAKDAGLIHKVRPMIDALVAADIYIRAEIITAIVRQAGEGE